MRYEEFPVGMRVLAVDDDPICLKLIESLLRKCRYHVTTTSEAVMALKLLRENKEKFDLVISDVHMPDMDGFKLLELVGLEMDLPVIMLSANGDTKLVMKGITHGACDYLLKPVRIEELKNIWQHVVRKKKVHPKVENNLDQHYDENESGQAHAATGDSDPNSKLNRKRKDQKEDDDEDRENELNIEESTAQKKARLVWTVDLHRKFVSAVRTLGVDKAVPKKILDMMNVENLTRENVASHLQKYRKYLNRISYVTSQQANMVAALGGSDTAFLRMTSVGGYANLHNTAIRPFSSTGLLGSRFSSPIGLSIPEPLSSGTIPLGQTQNWNNPMIQPKLQQVIIPGNTNGNILQGVSTSFDQLELDKGGGNCSEPLSIVSAKSQVFPLPATIIQAGGTVPLSNMEFPSELPDFGRCSQSWSAGQSHLFTSSDSLKMSIARDCGNDIFTTPENPYTIPSFHRTSGLRADFTQIIPGDENGLSAYQNLNLVCNPKDLMTSSHGVSGALNQYNESFGDTITEFSRSNDFDTIEIQSLGDPITSQQTHIEQSVRQTAVKMEQCYLLEQMNSHGGYSYGDGGSLEDLVSGMMKMDQDIYM